MSYQETCQIRAEFAYGKVFGNSDESGYGYAQYFGLTDHNLTRLLAGDTVVKIKQTTAFMIKLAPADHLIYLMMLSAFYDDVIIQKNGEYYTRIPRRGLSIQRLTKNWCCQDFPTSVTKRWSIDLPTADLPNETRSIHKYLLMSDYRHLVYTLDQEDRLCLDPEIYQLYREVYAGNHYLPNSDLMERILDSVLTFRGEEIGENFACLCHKACEMFYKHHQATLNGQCLVQDHQKAGYEILPVELDFAQCITLLVGGTVPIIREPRPICLKLKRAYRSTGYAVIKAFFEYLADEKEYGLKRYLQDRLREVLSPCFPEARL